MAFRISFSEWVDLAKVPTARIERLWFMPQFDVFEEEQHLCIVNILVPGGPSTFKYKNSEEQFKDALLRYAVIRIEEILRNKSFLIDYPQRVQEIHIEEEDLPSIDELLVEKNCTYQITEGRNLFCSAASLDDLVKGYSSPRRSITSHPVCLSCSLPDSNYLCSNLTHAAVMSRQGMAIMPMRFAAGALCDRGQSEINDPSQCRPGGHQCWERILEPEVVSPIIPLSPLALPEAFDYLDTLWRLAFGRKHGLLRLTTMTDMAQLAQPCTTRTDFESMMSALANILKSMNIPDDLLHKGSPMVSKDHTLDRIEACLKHRLEEENYLPCQRAMNILHAVNAVRYSLQHANQRDFSSALSGLAVPFPVSSWSETWATIRARTIEALGIIRENVRTFSHDEDRDH